MFLGQDGSFVGSICLDYDLLCVLLVMNKKKVDRQRVLHELSSLPPVCRRETVDLGNLCCQDFKL